MPISLLIAAALGATAPQPLAQPMIAAERGFAADAQRLGVRLAFLAHFDADSWLFRPLPVAALPALARDADDGAPLEWAPDLAGIAASGEFGFTSGPWSAHAPGTERPAHGHFLTIWKRGADGIWRVQVDGGIGHAPIAKPEDVNVLPISDAPASALSTDRLDQRRRSLEIEDDALRKALGSSPIDAWQRFADPDLRVLRSGHLPATGAEATGLIAHDPAQAGSGPRRALDIAESGELGYTIGGDPSCKPCGSYFRVWRWRNDRWHVLVDLTRPGAP